MLSMLLLMQGVGGDNVKYVTFNAGSRGGTMLSMLLLMQGVGEGQC